MTDGPVTVWAKFDEAVVVVAGAAVVVVTGAVVAGVVDDDAEPALVVGLDVQRELAGGEVRFLGGDVVVGAEAVVDVALEVLEPVEVGVATDPKVILAGVV